MGFVVKVVTDGDSTSLFPTSEEWSKYKTRTDNKWRADLEGDKTRNGLERFHEHRMPCHPFSSLGRWLSGALLQTHSSQHPSASAGGAGGAQSKQEAEALWTTGCPHSCHPAPRPTCSRDACR